MDKKNTVLGVALLLAAFGLMFYGAKTTPRPPPSPQIGKPMSVANPLPSNQAVGPATASLQPISSSDASLSSLNETPPAAKIISLANDFIEVRFVDFGGAIEGVALKKYPAFKGEPEPFVFNRAHTEPILAFTPDSFPGLDRSVHYDLISQTDHEVVFRTVLQNRLEVTRRYTLPPSNISPKEGDPYQLYHETTFRNLTAETVAIPHFNLDIGTAAPATSSDFIYISSGSYDGKDATFVERAKLEGGSFLSSFGVGSKEPTQSVASEGTVLWATVQDQFFASIVTPDTPARGFVSRRLEFPPLPGATKPGMGITSAVGFDVAALAPQAETKLGMSLYVGPKEYHRLANPDVFKRNQDKAMRFGNIVGLFSRILLIIMDHIHSWIGNWGWAIILTTLSLKTLFLPLTLSASKSAKRMQAVQPQLKEIREKYKDNPQKLNSATMAIFKENRVNPAGGCLPILITLPFFWGFYDMLRHTSELRFAEFLWVKDLSAPDTIAHIYGLPFNILPLFLAVVMFFQMRLTPQPTVDTQQAKLMKFMPLGMTLIYYNFPAALSLYSTFNGMFQIGQQLIINRMKDSAPPVAVKTNSNGRPIKNVTPGNRKRN